MIRLRLMTGEDLPLGLRLTAQARWNQTEADWRRAYELQPDGCFVAELDGVPAGTVTTCVFDETAWVALVLVEESLRGRGVGTALMRHALDFLDGYGVRRVRLDATPVGRPLYEKLGFVAEYPLSRHEGMLPAAGPAVETAGRVSAARAEHLEHFLSLDRAVTGTDRRKLLRHLFAEAPDVWRVVERGTDVLGFLAAREGCRALQIGPCLAEAEAGPLLLADAWRRYAGRRVFVDVPDGNLASVARAEAAGLRVQRPLLRMCRGPRPDEDVGRLWAAFGPEKG